MSEFLDAPITVQSSEYEDDSITVDRCGSAVTLSVSAGGHGAWPWFSVADSKRLRKALKAAEKAVTA